MAWLAEQLAEAGFNVAAPDHHGNNYVDGYAAAEFASTWNRPRDLSFILDHLAEHGAGGPVGAAGFSFGGYASAALLGARIDPDRYAAVLSGAVPIPPIPEYPSLLDELRPVLTTKVMAEWVAAAGADYRDDRVLASFLVAPGLGPFIAEDSLIAVGRPVAVRWGESDTIALPADNACKYATLIPGADGQSVGASVGHYDFLGSTAGGEPVRAKVAADAVAFFRSHLVR
jgi:predicted dienelactone hydrolase